MKRVRMALRSLNMAWFRTPVAHLGYVSVSRVLQIIIFRMSALALIPKALAEYYAITLGNIKAAGAWMCAMRVCHF